jgi:hypothetical protein
MILNKTLETAISFFWATESNRLGGELKQFLNDDTQ